MRRASFLASARSDLKNAYDYIAGQSGSQAVAKKFVQRLHDKCHRLAALRSTVGRPRPELGPGLRSFPYSNYILFFRYIDDRFEVVNILEGHRDIGPEGN